MHERPELAVVTAGTASGPASSWQTSFLAHAGQHRDVLSMAGAAEGAGTHERGLRTLGRSLATFQLGESGTGEHLFAAAADAGVDAAHAAALRLFVAEEQEHARLLALVLDELGVPRRHDHWTDAVFVRLRRAHSLRSEVLTLLVAEVIAIAYYGALRDGIPAGVLQDVFARIHADEVRHVEFHAQTFPPHLRHSPVVARLAARLIWNVLVLGASLVVAVDHGAALAVAGTRRREFLARVGRARRQLDRRLFGPAPI